MSYGPYKYYPATNTIEDEEFAALVNSVSSVPSEYDYTLKFLDRQEWVKSFSTRAEPAAVLSIGASTSNVCQHGLVPGECWFCTMQMDTSFRSMPGNTSVLASEVRRAHGEGMVGLLGRRKLYLVLDLDQTLLNSVRLFHLTAEEEYLRGPVESLPDSLRGSVHRLDRYGLLTKLRPFVHSFLREANNLFEMYICTRSSRTYALAMAKLLDPGNLYFNNYTRVKGKEDCPIGNMKSLEFLSGQENAVVILDDSEEVWEDKRSLIVAEKYFYFAAIQRHYKKDANFQSFSILKTDESEEFGGLATALNVLRRVHAEFFNMADRNQYMDVRQLVSRLVR